MRFFRRGKEKSHALFSLQVLELDSNAYDFTDALNLFLDRGNAILGVKGLKGARETFRANKI